MLQCGHRKYSAARDPLRAAMIKSVRPELINNRLDLEIFNRLDFEIFPNNLTVYSVRPFQI